MGLQQRCGVGVLSPSTSLSALFWTYGVAHTGAMEIRGIIVRAAAPQTPLMQGTFPQVVSYILALLHLHG